MTQMIVQLLGYIISGAVALVVASIQHGKTAALMEYRLEQLEKKVDKHNDLVERMYAVETKLGIIDLRKTI